MNHFYRSFLTAALFCFAGLLDAQDFHLTQYDAAPQNLNPAMTGLFDGTFRIHGHYRTQWNAIATNPYQTFELAYDMPLKRFAIGGQVMDYTAGAGNYNVFSFEAVGAYDIGVDKEIFKKESDLHHVSFGLQAGLIQKTINTSKLTWGEQYSYANGGGFDTSIPSGESFVAQTIYIPDFNAGLIYYYAKDNARANPFLGFSASHLTNPDESFYSQPNKLPLKYIVHGGCKVNINETIQLQPKFFIMHQTNDREFTMSLLGNYYLKQSDAYLIFGPTFRISGPLSKKVTYEQFEKDAAAIEFGMKYNRYVYRISYDINTSTLHPYTGGRGGLEFSVTYIAKKPKPNPIFNCPRL